MILSNSHHSNSSGFWDVAPVRSLHMFLTDPLLPSSGPPEIHSSEWLVTVKSYGVMPHKTVTSRTSDPIQLLYCYSVSP
jgi:hypothetical protein